MENTFVKLDECEGECTLEGYEGWVPVKDITWGMSRTVDMTDLGSKQRGYANAQFEKVTFNSEVSKASTDIMRKVATGKIDPLIEIHLCRTGDDASKGMEPYLIWKLENAFIDSYTMSGGEESIPLEGWTIGYRKVSCLYKEGDFKTGALNTTGEFVWNLETGKVG